MSPSPPDLSSDPGEDEREDAESVAAKSLYDVDRSNTWTRLSERCDDNDSEPKSVESGALRADEEDAGA